MTMNMLCPENILSVHALIVPAMISTLVENMSENFPGETGLQLFFGLGNVVTLNVIILNPSNKLNIQKTLLIIINLVIPDFENDDLLWF